MRVGIVSLFGNRNMGNKLQNYALEVFLRKYANCAVTIKNKPFRKNIGKYLLNDSVVADSKIINRLLRNKRKTCFIEFNNQYITCTTKTYFCNLSTNGLRNSDSCDLYCAGSDQIWNPYLGRSGMFNYLGFADYDRTFSYAASFGIEEIPEEHKEAVRKGLNHIKFISVREDSGKRIVEELTGRTDVQVLVDPTMLLTTQEWDAVAEKPQKKLPEKYLLTYFLGRVSQERRQAVEKKAAELGCETIWLMDKDSPFYAIGPGHFVYLIKHARMVCTDSFHGSVFSFLYEKPLAIFDREGSGENMGSRIRTLADKFQLEDCLVKNNSIPDVLEADYSAGYAALEEERKKSKAFLDMVFQEAERAGLCK